MRSPVRRHTRGRPAVRERFSERAEVEAKVRERASRGGGEGVPAGARGRGVIQWRQKGANWGATLEAPWGVVQTEECRLGREAWGVVQVCAPPR
eukprot:1970415-Prymnesium_polylepis.1